MLHFPVEYKEHFVVAMKVNSTGIALYFQLLCSSYLCSPAQNNLKSLIYFLCIFIYTVYFLFITNWWFAMLSIILYFKYNKPYRFKKFQS